MKPLAFAAGAAFTLAAGAAAQQARQQPVETPDGRDRTNQINFDKADKNSSRPRWRPRGPRLAATWTSSRDACPRRPAIVR